MLVFRRNVDFYVVASGKRVAAYFGNACGDGYIGQFVAACESGVTDIFQAFLKGNVGKAFAKHKRMSFKPRNVFRYNYFRELGAAVESQAVYISKAFGQSYLFKAFQRGKCPAFYFFNALGYNNAFKIVTAYETKRLDSVDRWEN